MTWACRPASGTSDVTVSWFELNRPNRETYKQAAAEGGYSGYMASRLQAVIDYEGFSSEYQNNP